MGLIKKACQSIAHGVGHAVSSVAHVAKSVATLDLKGAAHAAKNGMAGCADVARGLTNLTPAAIAVNTLTDGALDKMHQKIQQKGLEFSGRLVDTLEGGLTDIKQGTLNAAKALTKGDLRGVAAGAFEAGLGALNTAQFCSPSGVALMAGEAAREMAVEEAAKRVPAVVGDAVAAAAMASALGIGPRRN